MKTCSSLLVIRKHNLKPHGRTSGKNLKSSQCQFQQKCGKTRLVHLATAGVCVKYLAFKVEDMYMQQLCNSTPKRKSYIYVLEDLYKNMHSSIVPNNNYRCLSKQMLNKRVKVLLLCGYVSHVEWRNKLWYSHILTFFSARTMNDIVQ